MFNFEEKNLILTGIEKRISKKTDREYSIVNFLDRNGQTFGCMLDTELEDNFSQLDNVDVLFEVIPGRYTQLKVKGLKKV